MPPGGLRRLPPPQIASDGAPCWCYGWGSVPDDLLLHETSRAGAPGVPLPVVSHWVDGKPRAGDAERSGEVTNPATGAVTKTVLFATADDVDAAVRAAATAFREWRRTSLTKRARVLFAFRELLNQRKGELAAILTAEHGKVLSDALGEVTRGLEVVEFACGIPHLVKGSFSAG